MKICFVCHGNICRSIAAEVIAKKLIEELPYFDIEIISRAISNEELGNDIYPPMKRTLLMHGYKLEIHHATKINQFDYDSSDYIFYMDQSNKYYLERMFIDDERKIKPISIYAHNINDIEDPWYTGNFEKVYEQLFKCVKSLFNEILKDK